MTRTQILIFSGAGIMLLILLLVIFGAGRKPPLPQPATIEVWGVGDDESIWSDVLTKFHEKYPYISVNYRSRDEQSYEQTLLNSLASGRGPDVFFLKNSWVTKHGDKVFPLPQDFLKFSAADFKNLFVDGAADNLIRGDGQILGLPLFIDTPVLFYNKDIFNSAGIALAPQIWEDLENISRKLTVITPAGDVTQSGMALGSAKNVEHWFEIINSLIFQRGDPIINKAAQEVVVGKPAKNALNFFTSFTNPSSPDFSWSSRLPNSLDALAEGRTAMALGMADDISRIRAKNPHLNFDIAPFPRQADAKSAVLYGTYFFPTVSKFSKNPGPAWQLVFFITAQEGAKIYLEKSGRPSARRDLIAAGASRPELNIFYKQSLIARSWPIPDENAVIKIFGEAVESVLNRSSTPEQAVARIGEQLRLLLP